jgi:hypothetical protein
VGFELFLYLFYSCANGNLCIYIFIIAFVEFLLFICVRVLRRALVKNVITLFYYVAYMDCLEILFCYFMLFANVVAMGNSCDYFILLEYCISRYIILIVHRQS